ncbi:FAD-dependent oxidoreductase [Gulosibacter sediminis]|uniref:FAD-dependent oxidoreductase n=1 Tax=Gulosibacter sediminis TaxID=1729695 RepID=UPI0024A9BC3B|nr:FAD-dependent oxidoreductase [Gulosibacter sediminis]
MPQTIPSIESTHFDTVVVGFGKAGKTLAGMLARDGRRVALVEQHDDMFGGTCINIGCVPTKTLLHDADLRQQTGSDPAAAYDAAINRKRTLRGKMQAANLKLVETPGALVIVARAEFTGERTLRLVAGDDVLTVTADNVIIGTGATPRIPEIAGLPERPLDDPRVVTSTELIDADRLPRRLAVLGAGFIALELANLFREFGSAVTVLNRGATLAKSDDPESQAAIVEVLTGIGIDLRHETNLVRVDAPSEPAAPLMLTLERGGESSELEVDALLISAGRVPAVEGLGLERAGVEVEGGAIKVDEFLRTTAERVWAVGDVNGGPQHTYVSFDDHRIVADQLLRGLGEGGRSLATRGPVPSTTFITPPYSRVGLTATEARERSAAEGWDVAVARKNIADITAMPRPKAVNDPRGFFQLVVDRASGRILGATLFCVESQEVINLVTQAMRFEIPYTALRDGIYTHPSTTEALNEVLGLV